MTKLKRFRTWKRQYFKKRFLPAYSTGFRVPETRKGKQIFFFQDSIRRFLKDIAYVMQHNIVCIHCTSDLNKFQMSICEMKFVSARSSVAFLFVPSHWKEIFTWAWRCFRIVQLLRLYLGIQISHFPLQYFQTLISLKNESNGIKIFNRQWRADDSGMISI